MPRVATGTGLHCSCLKASTDAAETMFSVRMFQSLEVCGKNESSFMNVLVDAGDFEPKF